MNEKKVKKNRIEKKKIKEISKNNQTAIREIYEKQKIKLKKKKIIQVKKIKIYYEKKKIVREKKLEKLLLLNEQLKRRTRNKKNRGGNIYRKKFFKYDYNAIPISIQRELELTELI